MVMKPIIFSTEMVRAILDGRKTQTRRVVKPQSKDSHHPLFFNAGIIEARITTNRDLGIRCPCKPGDILWVREVWQDMSDNKGEYVYLVDGNEGLFAKDWGVVTVGDIKWRSSAHMPRAATRLFLRVTSVRVERLHDITPSDIDKMGTPFNQTIVPYEGFSELWDGGYFGKVQSSWDTNPWTWVIGFEKFNNSKGVAY